MDPKDKILGKAQHGVFKGKLCSSELLESFEGVGNHINTSDLVEAAYLDLQKSRPLTKTLLRALGSHGIRTEVLSWVK